jgi:hypothetical protein
MPPGFASRQSTRKYRLKSDGKSQTASSIMGSRIPGPTVCGTAALRGQTDDGDHFFFMCPVCADDTVMQILEYTVVTDRPVKYDAENRKRARHDLSWLSGFIA